MRGTSVHLEARPNLHFHLERLTAANIGWWRSFALQQRERSEADFGTDLSVRKIDKGIKAFLATIAFCDCPGIEAWVAFVADRDCPPAQRPDPCSIEMAVSMTTSASARFTGHMGIFRAIDYEGAPNRNLASALHGFVGRAAIDLYPGKSLMLTVAASRMREIIVNAFQDNGLTHEIFVGDASGRVRLGPREIEVAALALETRLALRTEMRGNGMSRCDSHLPMYEENELAISVLRQEQHLRYRPRTAPIRLNRDADGPCTAFELSAGDGTILHSFGPDEMGGEFAWFFHNPYFVRNPRQPPITLALEALAKFSPPGDLDVRRA
jgi:hypothetical protein